MSKQVVIRTYTQLLQLPHDQLRREINSMVTTVNSRLRRLEQYGLSDKSYYVTERIPTYIERYGTKSNRFMKASNKSSVEDLAKQMLVMQKVYNMPITKDDVIKSFKETAKRMNVTEDSLSLVYGLTSQGIVSTLFREYGSDIPKIVNNRQKAGQTNQQIIDDLKTAIDNNNSNIDIITDFAGDRAKWLLH